MTWRKPSLGVKLALFVGVTGLCGSGTGQLEGLKMRPGLWESTGTGGMAGATGRTVKVCYENTMNMQEYMNRMLAANPQIKCTIEHQVQTAHSVTFDENCSGTLPNGSMKTSGHIVIDFVDSEHVTSSSKSTISMVMQGKPMEMPMDISSSAKFVSPDCGSVKPFVMPATK